MVPYVVTTAEFGGVRLDIRGGVFLGICAKTARREDLRPLVEIVPQIAQAVLPPSGVGGRVGFSTASDIPLSFSLSPQSSQRTFRLGAVFVFA